MTGHKTDRHSNSQWNNDEQSAIKRKRIMNIAKWIGHKDEFYTCYGRKIETKGEYDTKINEERKMNMPKSEKKEKKHSEVKEKEPSEMKSKEKINILRWKRNTKRTVIK
jgi:hypothetical protein